MPQRELAEQVFRLRFQLSTGQAEGLKRLREARRDLARIKTLLRQNGIEEGLMATEPETSSQRAAGRAAHSRNWSAW